MGTNRNRRSEDAEKIILTYKDNEALDNGIISQIEKNIKKAATSNYWKNWVRRERAIRDHEKQHRLVAEDKPIQARIKEEKAAEKALAKKRKRDK